MLDDLLATHRTTIHYSIVFSLLFFFFAFITYTLFTTIHRRTLLTDITRRRSLSNAARQGEKIKFYIDEDEQMRSDQCGGALAARPMTDKDSARLLNDLV